MKKVRLQLSTASSRYKPIGVVHSWFAGFVEADGSFHIRTKETYYPKM
jgi:hypothetical protein